MAKGRDLDEWRAAWRLMDQAASTLLPAMVPSNFRNPADFGDSVIRMTLGRSGATVADYFTPTIRGTWSAAILTSPPAAHFCCRISRSSSQRIDPGGKEGSIYVIDRTSMGHYNPQNNSLIVQNLTGQIGGIYGSPAYWNGNVYFGASSDALKAFSLTNGMLSPTPTSSSAFRPSPIRGHPQHLSQRQQ